MRRGILYVVGLVGPFGSGCSYVAKTIGDVYGYEVLSLNFSWLEFLQSHIQWKKLRRF